MHWIVIFKTSWKQIKFTVLPQIRLSWEKQAWNLLVWARLIFKTTSELYTKTSESFELKSWGL